MYTDRLMIAKEIAVDTAISVDEFSELIRRAFSAKLDEFLEEVVKAENDGTQAGELTGFLDG